MRRGHPHHDDHHDDHHDEHRDEHDRGHRPPPPPPPPGRGPRGPRGGRGPRFDGPGPEEKFGFGPGFGPGFGFGRGGHDGPPPWVAKRMRRGDIRVAVLGALQDGPGHGYELMNRLADRSGGRWRPSPGSVYPTLQALQDEGLVTSVEADGKRVFELTEAGAAVAAERAQNADDPWADTAGPDGRAELWRSVGQLVAAAKQVGMHGSPELAAKAGEVLTDARRKLYQLLAEA